MDEAETKVFRLRSMDYRPPYRFALIYPFGIFVLHRLETLATHKPFHLLQELTLAVTISIFVVLLQNIMAREERNTIIEIGDRLFRSVRFRKTSLEFDFNEIHRLGYAPLTGQRAIYYNGGDVYRYGSSVEKVKELDDLLQQETGLPFVDLTYFKPIEIVYS